MRRTILALCALLYLGTLAAPCPSVAAVSSEAVRREAPVQLQHFCPCGCRNLPPGAGALPTWQIGPPVVASPAASTVAWPVAIAPVRAIERPSAVPDRVPLSG